MLPRALLLLPWAPALPEAPPRPLAPPLSPDPPLAPPSPPPRHPPSPPASPPRLRQSQPALLLALFLTLRALARPWGAAAPRPSRLLAAARPRCPPPLHPRPFLRPPVRPPLPTLSFYPTRPPHGASDPSPPPGGGPRGGWGVPPCSHPHAHARTRAATGRARANRRKQRRADFASAFPRATIADESASSCRVPERRVTTRPGSGKSPRLPLKRACPIRNQIWKGQNELQPIV